MPLKLVPRIVSPDLLFVLSSMGHGDEIGIYNIFVWYIISSEKSVVKYRCKVTEIGVPLTTVYVHVPVYLRVSLSSIILI